LFLVHLQQCDCHATGTTKNSSGAVQENSSSVDAFSCTVNVLAGTTYLTQAGLAIAQSAEDCVHLDAPNGTVYCAADILNVVQSILNTAGYFLGVASTCVDTLRLNASCASNIVGLIGNAVEAAGALTAASVDCPLPVQDSQQVQQEVVVPRKLEERERASPPLALGTFGDMGERGDLVNVSSEAPVTVIVDNETGLTGLATGWCVLNSVDSAVYLAQAANNILLATGDCNKTHIDTLGSAPACVSDVMGILSSFADVAGYLSGAALTCAKTLNLEAACGADMGSVLNGLFGVASAGAAAASNCNYLPLPLPLEPTFEGRRLADDAAPQKRPPDSLYP
jgi:hypothetical protein